MSTPAPMFHIGTRVIAQTAAGVTGPGMIFARGAAAGQANIAFFNAATGAATVLNNANYISEDTSFTAGQDQFKLNFRANP